MPIADLGSARIHFEVEGTGYPVLLLAPGGMRSSNEVWGRMPWNPRVALADRYQVIGMDQRNAGSSTGPIAATDGWATYIGDQLALLDHLEVERCHILGMCIGGAFIIGLLRAAPERFTAAVALQPVGIDGNRGLLEEVFDSWAEVVAPEHPEADSSTFAAFRRKMWTDDRFLAASPAEVATIATPLLVCMGDDQYHPQSVSRALAELAPGATLVERWKDDEVLAATDTTIKEFLASHTP